jgi:hypothetical protein
VAARYCTTRRSNAHRTANPEEREVLYPWHPWAGCLVCVHEAIEKVDGIVLRCSRDGATKLERKPSSLSRGTDGSNPAPSSGESGANLAFGGRSPKRRRRSGRRIERVMKTKRSPRHLRILRGEQLAGLGAGSPTRSSAPHPDRHDGAPSRSPARDRA